MLGVFGGYLSAEAGSEQGVLHLIFKTEEGAPDDIVIGKHVHAVDARRGLARGPLPARDHQRTDVH